jgi:hypothetical protein
VKFGIGVVSEKLSIECEIRENWLTDSHHLLMVVN